MWGASQVCVRSSMAAALMVRSNQVFRHCFPGRPQAPTDAAGFPIRPLRLVPPPHIFVSPRSHLLAGALNATVAFCRSCMDTDSDAINHNIVPAQPRRRRRKEPGLFRFGTFLSCPVLVQDALFCDGLVLCRTRFADRVYRRVASRGELNFVLSPEL